eukprot:1782387-Prymnesium_polylepis.1
MKLSRHASRWRSPASSVRAPLTTGGDSDKLLPLRDRYAAWRGRWEGTFGRRGYVTAADPALARQACAARATWK